jgi:dynein heavy chain
MISIASFDDQTLDRIFSTILDWHFVSGNFSKEIISITKNIVSATTDLYRASVNNLLPTPKKSHYTFNLRDFARVVQGILLVRADQANDPKKIIHLWLHEAYRVFYDRLVDDVDRKWLFEFSRQAVTKNFVVESFDNIFSEYDNNHGGKIEEDDLRSLIFGTYLSPREATGKAYCEINNLTELTEYVDRCVVEHNQISKKPLDLVMFRFAIEHLSRISRVLQQPRGNILLAGVGGSGRQSLTRLAAYCSEYDLFQIESNMVSYH